MPLPQALLAVLSRGPNHGYELKSLLEADLGPAWSPINVGHFYQVLDRLARDGYVASRQVRQQVRPDRTVYRITAAGRAELDSWLTQATDAAKERRSDLLLKLVAAAYLGEDTLRSVIKTERRAHLEALHALSNKPTLPTAHPSRWLVAEAAQLDLDTRLKILALAEDNLATLTASVGRTKKDNRGNQSEETLPA